MMIKKNSFIFNFFKVLLFSCVFAINSVALYSQEYDPMEGKKLFNVHCASCHKLNKKATGPAL